MALGEPEWLAIVMSTDPLLLRLGSGVQLVLSMEFGCRVSQVAVSWRLVSLSGVWRASITQSGVLWFGVSLGGVCRASIALCCVIWVIVTIVDVW